MKKLGKKIAITYYSILGLFIILLVAQFLTPLNPVGQTLSNVQYVKQYIVSYLNIPDTFNPLTGLDITGITPVPAGASAAPAISCTLTNNVHLVGTDGSDYSLNSATGYFQPYLQNVVTPYNNTPLDHILLRVYLYCAQSTLSQYGYYPYLTGGTLTSEFKSADVNGAKQHAWGYNVNVNPGDANGVSMLIAEFNEPVSAINTIANTAGVDYASLQDVSVTGNLIFKQKLNQNVQFTYPLQPLHTYFGFLIQSPGGSQQKTQQYINMLTPSQAASFTIDKSKSNTVIVQVGVNGYTTSESAPVISIYPQLGGVTQSNNPIADYTLPVNPNDQDNGGYKQWKFAVDISKLSAGTYEIGLHGQTLSSGQTRPWVHTVFQVIDTSSANNGLPCTASQLAANPPYTNVNGVCTPPANTPPGTGGNGPVTCQPPLVVSTDGKSCALPNIPNVPNIDPTSALAWLSNTNNLMMVIGVIIIIGILYHFANKKKGGQGLQPQVIVE